MKDERGAISFVLLAPLVLAASLMVIQVSLWSHASRAAESAARQGASEASLAGSSDDQGKAVAERWLQHSAGDLLEDIVIAVDRSQVEIVVTVDARAPGLLPGMSHSVHAVAVVPIESFRAS